MQGAVDRRRLFSGFNAWYSETLPHSRSATLLDFGAGRGDLLRWLTTLGYSHLVGFDVLDDYEAQIQSDTSARMCVGSDGNAFLRERPAVYDWILFKDVLEHVDPTAAIPLLESARFAMRPGATIVISGPHAASPGGIYTRYADHTHRSCFTLPSLEHALRSAGFEAVQCVQPRVPWSWRPSALALRCARGAWFTALRAMYTVELPGEPQPPHFWPRITVHARATGDPSFAREP